MLTWINWNRTVLCIEITYNSNISFQKYDQDMNMWNRNIHTDTENVQNVHMRIGIRKHSKHFVMFWPSTRPQKMLFQGDAPEGSDTFQWPVIERDCMGGLRLIILDKVKVPLCQYRLMHRKRVTSELHDSYFRLMTIKHSISKIQWTIVWALNYYLTLLSSSPRSSCQ